MNSVKRQKIGHQKMSLPGHKVSNILLKRAPERIKRLGQNGNDAQLQICLVIKVKSDAVKNNIA